MTFWLCEPIAKAGEDRRTEIERLADEVSPQIARAVREALQAQIDALDLDAIEAALRRGDQAAVLALVGAMPPTRAAAITDAIETAVWQGGAAVVRTDPVLSGADFAFNRLNPALVRWLQDYELNLIREIDAGTLAAVRTALTDGMVAGQNPVQTARRVRESVGLTAKQARAVQNYRAFLETIHERRSVKALGLGREIDRRNGRQVFRPSKDGTPKDEIDLYRLRDFRYDGVLQRAMAQSRPLTAKQIDTQVAAYQRKYLRHRSETIARTESMRATSAGVLDAWRQAIAEGKVDGARVRKRWITAADERTCVICSPIPRMNPARGVPLEARFASPRGPIAAPPAHPNCRCSPSVRLLEPSQLQENDNA